MKFLSIFWITLFLTCKISAQEIRFVNTQDLLPTAEKFGVDSALNLSRGFPIFQIDSITALNLVGLLTDYERYSINDKFFNQMSHNWKNKLIKEKTKIFAISQLKKIESSLPNKFGKIPVLDDRLIISITDQRPELIEDYLIQTYKTCSIRADSLRNEFPSIFVRFFKSFKNGTLPIVATYQDYQMNCYKIMWTLGQLGNQFFDRKKLEYHNSKLKRWQRDSDILRFRVNLNEYKTQIINLKHSYSSIKDIDFQNETELNSILQDYNLKDKCWKFILYNDNSGFLDLGCSYGPLAGNGILFRIEIINNSQIKLTEIGAWIS